MYNLSSLYKICNIGLVSNWKLKLISVTRLKKNKVTFLARFDFKCHPLKLSLFSLLFKWRVFRFDCYMLANISNAIFEVYWRLESPIWFWRHPLPISSHSQIQVVHRDKSGWQCHWHFSPLWRKLDSEEKVSHIPSHAARNLTTSETN